jgi:prepilin-type N-terminal cleavage/methylation domain-containing protein
MNPTPRRGFSLIEVMVAVTLMGIVLMSLGKVAAVSSQRGRTNDLLAKRTFALQQQANLLGSLPYANLAGLPTSKSYTAGDFTFTRRLTITATTQRTTIRVVVVPSADTMRKDSVTVERNGGSGSPLCQGC